jgi:Fe-S cluster biogenesis protein NfuA
MNIYTELTPNPSSLKFITEDYEKSFPTYDFPNLESAEKSELAKNLFALGYVTGVMFSKDHFKRNFVTISKTDDAKWENIIPEIKKVISEYLLTGKPLVDGYEETQQNYGDDVIDKIKSLIDNEIRPAVAMDGGDITFEGFEDGVVKLHLKGSCSGCPSSLITLKQGIQALLTRMVPEVKSVEAI